MISLLRLIGYGGQAGVSCLLAFLIYKGSK